MMDQMNVFLVKKAAHVRDHLQNILYVGIWKIVTELKGKDVTMGITLMVLFVILAFLGSDLMILDCANFVKVVAAAIVLGHAQSAFLDMQEMQKLQNVFHAYQIVSVLSLVSVANVSIVAQTASKAIILINIKDDVLDVKMATTLMNILKDVCHAEKDVNAKIVIYIIAHLALMGIILITIISALNVLEIAFAVMNTLVAHAQKDMAKQEILVLTNVFLVNLTVYAHIMVLVIHACQVSK